MRPVKRSDDSSFRRLRRGASVFRTYSEVFPPHLSLPLRDLLQSMLAFEKEERPARRTPATHPLPALLGLIQGISRKRKTMGARAMALSCLILRCR